MAFRVDAAQQSKREGTLRFLLEEATNLYSSSPFRSLSDRLGFGITISPKETNQLILTDRFQSVLLILPQMRSHSVHVGRSAKVRPYRWGVCDVLTSEYRAESFSTVKLPLAGQYAGGTPLVVGAGSCSTSRYCLILSRLLARRHLV